ncbi:ABC transporter substrate-binding protein [Brucella pseudogrignonensis]|uniref:ABC transporter substrate-binding protein n=1 Tax=Brucella pseudogrignonensis TaxID=419475 RepID=UPI003ECC7FC6
MKKVLIGAALVGMLSTFTAAHAADKLSVMFPTFTGNAPVIAASSEGIFAKDNLDVDYRFEDDPSNVFAAMQRGDIDVDIRTIGEYEMRPRTEDSGTVIIGTIDRSVGGDGVVAAGDIKSVKDLEGKTVAVTVNAPAWTLLQLELTKAGVPLDAVQTRNIEIGDTAAVFSDPSISAIATSQPFLSQLLTIAASRQPHVLVSSAQSSYIVDVIIARKADVEANPDKYRRFLKSLYTAVKLHKSDPDVFYNAAAKPFNLTAEQVKDSVVGSLEYTDLAQAKQLLGTSAAPGELFPVFEKLMQLNIAIKSANGPLKPENHIDGSILSSISESDLK